MRVENWCMVTLDSEDLQLGKGGNGLEVVLPDNTRKVVIKVTKSVSEVAVPSMLRREAA